MTLPRLRRIRRAVRAALTLGLAVSLAANVLHADNNIISRLIAGWPPLALAITIELISRVPSSSRWLSAVRILGTSAVAAIAAWVSYWHMAGVALRYGEDTVAAHLVPLTVDGMVVVASVCLVEIGRLTRTAEHIPAEPDDNLPAPVPDRLPPVPAPVPDSLAVVPAAGDNPPAGIPHATPEVQPGPVLPHPRTPPTRLVPSFLAPVPDNATPVPDNPEPVPDNGDNGGDSEGDDDSQEIIPDPDPLLDTVLELSRTIPRLSRTTLLAELRQRGHKCGTDRAKRLLELLADEREALSGTAGTAAGDGQAP